MKKLRWQLLIIFITGLVVGVLLLGEQPKQGNTPSTPNNPGDTPAVPGATQPASGGIYTEALVGSLMRLNPLLGMENSADRDISRLLFSGLVRFDGRGAAQVDLAETMGISKDGTLYNFRLRKDAKWHDGEPVTTDDVIFTVNLFKQGGGPLSQDMQDFWKSVEVVKLDDQNIQFRLPEAFSPFLDYLSFGILPQHLLNGVSLDQMIDSPFNLNPVGTGAYRFDHLLLENGEIKGVELTAFSQYYADKALIDHLVLRYYPDSAAALRAYQDGQVQGISQVTPDTLKQVLAEPNLSVYTAREPKLSMVLFNLKSTDATFLGDAKFRKAMMQALNRQWIVDHILGGQAAVSDSPILPDTWAYYDNPAAPDYNPDAARALLKDDGFALAKAEDTVRSKKDPKDNTKTISLQFTLLYPQDDTHKAIAEYMRSAWLAIGVQADLTPLPYDQLLHDHLDARDYQAALIDLNLSRSPDPDPYPFWDQAQATGGQNYTQWDSRVASEYLEQARTSVNMVDRAKYYRSFQMVFSRELPALPLYFPMYTYAVDKNIQGIRMGPLFDASDRFNTVTTWYLVSGKKPASSTSNVELGFLP